MQVPALKDMDKEREAREEIFKKKERELRKDASADDMTVAPLREVLDEMNVTYRKNEKRNTVGEESQRDPSQSMPPRIVIAVQNILYNRAGKHQN